MFDKIVGLAKSRGFIFAGSEIYGGLANTWDYGPLGVELKNNIKKHWWKKFITEQPYNVGLDSSILMNSKTWEASGHLAGFSDPLMDCRDCKSRFRADTLIENAAGVSVNDWSDEQMLEFIRNNDIKCTTCGGKNFTDIRKFNLMFKTFMGVTEDSSNVVYLRPETAQGIFVNFANVMRTTRKKLPFGIGQIGKSFRNEITPGNFIFRTREFEQMELEFFCEADDDMQWFDYWQKFCYDFLIDLGIRHDNLHIRNHSADELSHYSKATSDIEYKFQFGQGELWGIANRGDYDLRQHQNASRQTLHAEPLPFCIEPSVGVDRLLLAVLCDAYHEEQLENDTRIVLKLHHSLAPIKAAVLPLSKKLSEPAFEIYNRLCKSYVCEFDETGSIGKRYRRQDEIGTPLCITFDFDSQTDSCVTIRERDSMKQSRVAISELENVLNDAQKKS